MKGERMLPKPWSPAYVVKARTMEGTEVLLKMLPEAETNGQKCPASLLFLCRLVGLTLASQDQVEEARKFGFETCR